MQSCVAAAMMHNVAVITACAAAAAATRTAARLRQAAAAAAVAGGRNGGGTLLLLLRCGAALVQLEAVAAVKASLRVVCCARLTAAHSSRCTNCTAQASGGMPLQRAVAAAAAAVAVRHMHN